MIKINTQIDIQRGFYKEFGIQLKSSYLKDIKEYIENILNLDVEKNILNKEYIKENYRFLGGIFTYIPIECKKEILEKIELKDFWISEREKDLKEVSKSYFFLEIIKKHKIPYKLMNRNLLCMSNEILVKESHKKSFYKLKKDDLVVNDEIIEIVNIIREYMNRNIRVENDNYILEDRNLNIRNTVLLKEIMIFLKLNLSVDIEYNIKKIKELGCIEYSYDIKKDKMITYYKEKETGIKRHLNLEDRFKFKMFLFKLRGVAKINEENFIEESMKKIREELN